jgi:hypothetical protein
MHPKIRENVKPEIKISKLELDNSELKISRIFAPKTAGTERRKENLKANSFFQPMARADAIVTPDLEIPGRRAKA